MDVENRPDKFRYKPTTGDVLRLAEGDYCYGDGSLTLRVTAVGANLDLFPNLEWLSLRGVEVGRDGFNGPERQVLVRTTALQRARG